MSVKRESDAVIFEAPVTFSILPEVFLNKFASGDTTPSVLNKDTFLGSGSTVTVTNFDDGNPNDSIKILGDGTTTVANNTHIKTNTGANKLLATNKVYRFSLFNNIWYEDA